VGFPGSVGALLPHRHVLPTRLRTKTMTLRGSRELSRVQDDMLGVAESWGEHGFDVDLGLVSHVGERNDVAEYLASRNWLSQKTTLQELLTANGLPWGDADGTVFAKNYYCASILQP
jgi:O-methyltransferase involved in polyketide biosynthesis